jgi:hypothetical protein
LQKNVEGLEKPIAFFSRALRDDELKYDIMDKQSYALVKDLKSFRVYVPAFKSYFLCPISCCKINSYSA